MSLTVSYGFCLFLTVTLVSLSYFMSLPVYYCCWLSFTVSTRAMQLLHVSH